MKLRIAALTSPLSGSDGPVNLIPDGTFRAVDGRPHGISGWRIDAAIAGRVIHAVRTYRDPDTGKESTRSTKLVINYEHPQANGQPMPAAGFVDRSQLTYQPGVGISAPVQWTARARAHIDAGEYAYLSPVISYDPKSGEVRDLHLAGLTNTPALDSLLPLAALAERLGLDLPTDTEDSSMSLDIAALRQKLGIADDADGTAILEKVGSLVAQTQQVAALSEQVATLKAAAPDRAQYVPLAVYQEALAALKQAGESAETAELSALIEKGLTDGRIPGEQTVAWLKSQPLDAVRRYLADAPVLAALKSTQTAGRHEGEKPAALTEEQRTVCALMGIPETEFLKTLEAA